MYNLIEYSDNSLETLWKYHRDKPFMNNNGAIVDIPDDPDNASYNYKQKITGQIGIVQQKIFK